jgi:hypothetical protein
MEEMKQNGDIIRPEEVNRIQYGKFGGNDADLNDLIGSDDESGDELFNAQYRAK